MKFNNKTLDQFRADFDKAVAELAKKYDVKISMGNIRYTDCSFTTKLTVQNTDSIKDSKEDRLKSFADQFKIFHGLYDLKEDMLNKQWQQGSKTFTFVGIDGKQRKNVCIIVDQFGNTYKTTPRSLVLQMSR